MVNLFKTPFLKNKETRGVMRDIEYMLRCKDGSYILWMEEDRGYQVLDDFKYINHHNKANAAYYDDFTVMAIKNIKKDEEITHYYGEDWGD